MFKKKAKGDKIKIQFNISFISLKEIPANCSGKEIFIQCKRGKKSANTKNTRHVTIKEKEHSIDDKLSFSVSFVQKDKKYEPKKEIAFSLTELNGKKEEAIAKNKLDLSEYAEPGTVRHQSITLYNKDKKKSGTLALKIEAQPIKIGDKLAVKATASTDKPTVNIGGENYTLQTSDEITETNASNSDGEEDIDFPDEDTVASPNKQISNLNAKPKSSSVSTTESPLKNEVKSNSSAVDNAALADAKRDNERLQRKIDRLEAAAKSAPASNSPSAAELAENEDLKRDKQRLERKVEKLSQQLEELRAVSPATSRREGENNAEASSASAAAVEMEKQLKTLLSDKKKLEDELEESNRNCKKENSEKNKMKDELERMTKKESEARKKAEDTEKKKNGEVEQTKKELSAKETALIALEVELKSLKESSKSSKNEKGNNDAELKELQVQVRSAEVEKERLQEELSKLKKERIDLNEKVDTLKEEKEKTEKESDKWKRDCTENTKELKELKVSLKKHEENSRQYLEEKTTLNRKITQLEDENTDLKEERDDKRRGAMSDTQATQQLENELNALRKKNEELNNKVVSLEAKGKDLNLRISELETERNREKHEKDDLQSQLKELELDSQKGKSELKDKIKELKKELQEKSEEVSKLEEEVAKEKSKSKSSSTPSSPTVSSSSNEDKEKIKDLEKKNSKLEKQIGELKEELEEAGDQSSHKEKKLQKLLDDSEKEIQNLKAELEKSSSSLSKSTTSSKSTSDNGIDEEEAVKLKLQAKRAERESDSLKKKIASLQKENQEKSLVENGIYAADVEYEDEIPVGVKHLVDGMLESNAFEPFNEDLASSILNAIKKSFARSAYDSETLTYWLSFSIHLFKRVKSELPNDVSIDERALSKQDMIEDLDDYDSVTKFLLELINVSFDIYSVLLINVFSQLDSVLISTILSVAESKGKKSAPTGDFTGLLSDTMKMLKKHHLSDSLVRNFVQQMFSFIDSQLFNNLIQKPDLFTCSAGFQIKMAISQVESNVSKLDKSLTFINKSLNHIKEAVNFLVMDKSIVSDADMVEQIFSHLNVIQLKHMIDRFKPDELSPDPVPEVAKKAVADATKKRSDLPLELDAMEIKKVNLLSV
eukprot:TRINITY_DN916_c0_g1_i1.p1 TRINITY_DN916_c0_g1~~TRINITY_DN916_c0_g1_i1.p1  ORF type:complete len:1118 (+),score=422.97 TRINITY_DN916_c0_g1_i1:178-3531(+)